jgi:hypothetical protein
VAFSWAARCAAKRNATEGISYRPYKQRRPPAWRRYCQVASSILARVGPAHVRHTCAHRNFGNPLRSHRPNLPNGLDTSACRTAARSGLSLGYFGLDARPQPDEFRGLRLQHVERPAREALRHTRGGRLARSAQFLICFVRRRAASDQQAAPRAGWTGGWSRRRAWSAAREAGTAATVSATGSPATNRCSGPAFSR